MERKMERKYIVILSPESPKMLIVLSISQVKLRLIFSINVSMDAKL